MNEITTSEYIGIEEQLRFLTEELANLKIEHEQLKESYKKTLKQSHTRFLGIVYATGIFKENSEYTENIDIMINAFNSLDLDVADTEKSGKSQKYLESMIADNLTNKKLTKDEIILRFFDEQKVNGYLHMDMSDVQALLGFSNVTSANRFCKKFILKYPQFRYDRINRNNKKYLILNENF